MRTLKPGPRPFYALGTISGLIVVFAAYVAFKSGDGRFVGYALLVPALFVASIAFVRVELDEREIRLFNFGVVWKRAKFADIGHSVTRVLAEPDWPVALTILGTDGTSELMTVRLKMLRREDVHWLLARPELKVRE